MKWCTNPKSNVQIAAICGLCAGCRRAVEQTLTAVQRGPVTLYKSIVHNPHINQMLTQAGVTIADDLATVTPGSTVVLRAHGEPPATYTELKRRGFQFLDCTCPHVKRIHELIRAAGQKHQAVVLVGNYGKTTGKIHPEVAGAQGYAQGDIALVQDCEDVTTKLANWRDRDVLVVGQTTFGARLFDEIVQAIQTLAGPKNLRVTVQRTLCQATAQIQKCAVELCQTCDLMVVVGGQNSHNSRELYRVVAAIKPAILIEDITQWQAAVAAIGFPLRRDTRVGITAGASTDRAELVTLQKNLIAKLSQL